MLSGNGPNSGTEIFGYVWGEVIGRMNELGISEQIGTYSCQLRPECSAWWSLQLGLSNLYFNLTCIPMSWAINIWALLVRSMSYVCLNTSCITSKWVWKFCCWLKNMQQHNQSRVVLLMWILGWYSSRYSSNKCLLRLTVLSPCFERVRGCARHINERWMTYHLIILILVPQVSVSPQFPWVSVLWGKAKRVSGESRCIA